LAKNTFFDSLVKILSPKQNWGYNYVAKSLSIVGEFFGVIVIVGEGGNDSIVTRRNRCKRLFLLALFSFGASVSLSFEFRDDKNSCLMMNIFFG